MVKGIFNLFMTGYVVTCLNVDGSDVVRNENLFNVGKMRKIKVRVKFLSGWEGMEFRV